MAVQQIFGEEECRIWGQRQAWLKFRLHCVIFSKLVNLSDSVFLSVKQGQCLSLRAVLEMKINHKSKLLVSSPVLWHQLDVLQFNSILTLPWVKRAHKKKQGHGQDSTHFRGGPLTTCTSDRLDYKFEGSHHPFRFDNLLEQSIQRTQKELYLWLQFDNSCCCCCCCC